jgi:protein-L-isoaspartate(D-aspartate) O-methyltransferase
MSLRFAAAPVVVAMLAVGWPGCRERSANPTSQKREAAARERMVRSQIEQRGVKDPRVLAAMREVPRHLFVDKRYAAEAYEDRPVPIGEGQTMSQPYIVALMTELLDIQPGDRILEIGTGSGYQAAVLGRLARTVFSLERIDELARRAAGLLKSLGYTNVSIKAFDGSYGYALGAPYDRIIVTAATPSVPRPLLDQLAVGGRLVIPVGSGPGQRLRIIRKRKTDYSEQEGPEVTFVPLIGRYAKGGDAT